MPPSRIDESREFVPVRIAVMTVSDERDQSNDISGDTLESRIKEAGHIVAARLIAEHDRAQIAVQLRRWIADPQVDVVISIGGTGLSNRDVTVEAFKSVFDKEIDGFPVLFHQLSRETLGTSTMRWRACAGAAKGTFLFALPDSAGAVADCWDGILKSQLDTRHRSCNLTELMPRLIER